MEPEEYLVYEDGAWWFFDEFCAIGPYTTKEAALKDLLNE